LIIVCNINHNYQKNCNGIAARESGTGEEKSVQSSMFNKIAKSGERKAKNCGGSALLTTGKPVAWGITLGRHMV
jgi:hypothetical protein